MSGLDLEALYRVCEECGKGFYTKQKNARFCRDKCRFRAWDREHPREPAKQPYNGSAGGKRRASRDGKGTRVYLTPDELTWLVQLEVPGSVVTKAIDAIERLKGTR